MAVIKKGSTDVTMYVYLGDSADGTPETGLTITDIDITYIRNRAAHVKADATAASAVDAAHSDNTAIEVSSTQAPGIYRVDFPDAAFATGVDKVVLAVTCTGCAPAYFYVGLSDADGADVQSILADTNELQSDWTNGGRLDLILDATATQTTASAILADTNELQTDWADGGRLDLILDARASQASVDTVDTNVDAILLDTNELQTDWVDGGRLDLILDARASQVSVDAVPTAIENADELLKRDWTAVAGEAARSTLNALRFLRNKWSVAAGTLTVTEEDDLTPAWTASITTDPAADPVTGSDPT